MNESPLTKEMLENPADWELCLRVSDTDVYALLHHHTGGGAMIGRSISIAPGNDPLPQLETFVYDNPLLLSDFRSVTVVVETSGFTLTPLSVKDEDVQRDVFQNSLPDLAGKNFETVTNSLTNPPLNIVFAPSEKLLTFVRRTFHNPRIVSHLTPLLNYFALRRKEGNQARTFIQLRRQSLDVVIFQGNAPALCNRFEFSHVDDAVYYVLACRRSVGDLDPDNDEIYISGDLERRRDMSPLLGKFVKNILPVIFPPSLFRQAREVMDAPFDLILVPLCE